jgi:hypothetical protein
MSAEEFPIPRGGPPPERVTAWGREFRLVGNSRWQLAYEHGKDVFIFSKITYGLFDFSFFDKFTPDDLRLPEKAHAAVSIFTAPASETQQIPQVWLDFAKDFCTNPPPEIGPRR